MVESATLHDMLLNAQAAREYLDVFRQRRNSPKRGVEAEIYLNDICFVT